LSTGEVTQAVGEPMPSSSERRLGRSRQRPSLS